MPINYEQIAATEIDCARCKAACCRLEVIIFTDTGVPERYIERDQWGGEVMARLEDGWCAALDRDTYLCKIYENRPLICREFAMQSGECLEEFMQRDKHWDKR